MLKFGCSTRMFILQGPPEDEEPESELTVTEMKQQYKDKLAAMEAERVRQEEIEAQQEEENRRREEERGIDWGMGKLCVGLMNYKAKPFLCSIFLLFSCINK